MYINVYKCIKMFINDMPQRISVSKAAQFYGVHPKTIREWRNNEKILNIKHTKTSDQGSTSNEKNLSPFWTNHCKEWSKKLWSPVKIDYVASHSNCMNGCSKETEQNLHIWLPMQS